tara:strand:+ start:45 stop:284 length:240 start_codon:yes stop_codon:yes gene_type:complete
MNDLNEKDWKEWAHNPCTQKFVENLKTQRQEYLEKIGSGFYKPEGLTTVIGVCQSILHTINSIEESKEIEEVEDVKEDK